MAKEIALNTKTAIDEMVPAGEGELLKEGREFYEAEFEGWDDFVGQVLEWLGVGLTEVEQRAEEKGGPSAPLRPFDRTQDRQGSRGEGRQGEVVIRSGRLAEV